VRCDWAIGGEEALGVPGRLEPLHAPFPLPVDGEKNFIQVPLVLKSGTLAVQLIDIGLPEFPTLRPHHLMGQDDATFRHELSDTPIA
jgi:hypothetical protein